MSIVQAVRSTILTTLAKRPLYLPESDRIALAKLLEAGFIEKTDLLCEVDRKLKEIGRACYGQHLASRSASYRIWPDHTIHPEAFAYALATGEFKGWEKWLITFDHDDNEESFVKQHGVNTLPERILNKWLDTTPPPEHKLSGSDMDDHCCCSH